MQCCVFMRCFVVDDVFDDVVGDGGERRERVVEDLVDVNLCASPALSGTDCIQYSLE